MYKLLYFLTLTVVLYRMTRFKNATEEEMPISLISNERYKLFVDEDEIDDQSEIDDEISSLMLFSDSDDECLDY